MRKFVQMMAICPLLMAAFGVTQGDAAAAEDGDLLVRSGYCEYLENPLGIDTPTPRLGWKLDSQEATGRNLAQRAYQIQAASSPELLAEEPDLWDSGKVASAQQLQVPYAGDALDSRQQVYWRVRVWDQDDEASPWSPVYHWEMGLLNAEDWEGEWIQEDAPPVEDENELYAIHPAPLLRKGFTLGEDIVQARAYVSGLGYYEMRLNGEKVGDLQLEPGWTAYAHRVFYTTYDVTEQLQAGDNAVGLILGNGWFNPLPLRMWGRFNLREHLTIGAPRALLQLEVEYADGSVERIVTNNDWKTAESEILKNNVYLGEMIDARLAKVGWDTPDYDDSAWEAAAVVSEDLGPLTAQPLPPIRVTDTIEPVAITEPEPGVYIYDFGENLAGVVRFAVEGTAGSTVSLRYGELLYPDGTLNPMTAVWGQVKNVEHPEGSLAPSTAWQEDNFILAGTGEQEVFQPRFTFHGFRYVEVKGHPDEPALEDIVALRLHSDVPEVGEIETSNPLINEIQEISVRALDGNLHAVQSDCPAREKFGYGGDIVASSDFAMLNKDMAAFYKKAVHDFGDEVRPNGGITETAPYVGIADRGMGDGSAPVGWGSVHPLLLWQLYQYYGESALIEEQYDIAKGWVALITDTAENHILDNCIGDHETLAPFDRVVTTTAFYYYNTVLMARLAEILDKPEDKAYYEALGEDIKEAFNTTFLDTETGAYGEGAQANQAFALYHDLVPEAHREQVLAHLVQDIQEEHDGKLSTGIFGTKYMLHVLAEQGKGDVAYDMINHREFPGWGYMIENGATTLWEHWAYSDNTFSHNHPMFGSVSEWFYKVLLGIQPAEDAMGFDRVTIAPYLPEDMDWARGSYNSIRGAIAVSWRKQDDGLRLEVRVPIGVQAEVHVPHGEGDAVACITPEDGVTRQKADAITTRYQVGSGTHIFEVTRQ